MFQQIAIGLVGIIIGICMVVFARWLVRNVGTAATAEKYIGSGGTYTVLRIGGILVILIFFLYMIGYLNYVILSIYHAIFGG